MSVLDLRLLAPCSFGLPCLYPPGGDVGHIKQEDEDSPAMEPKGT